MEWTSTQFELPPMDGSYEVTNNPWNAADVGIAIYDGFGFKLGDVYRSVDYWRSATVREKRYGKVKQEPAAPSSS